MQLCASMTGADVWNPACHHTGLCCACLPDAAGLHGLQRDCVIGSILARNQYCHACLGFCDEPAQTWERPFDPLGDNNWAQGLTHFYDKAKIRKSSAGSFNTRGVVCCPHPLLSIFLFSLPGPFFHSPDAAPWWLCEDVIRSGDGVKGD